MSFAYDLRQCLLSLPFIQLKDIYYSYWNKIFWKKVTFILECLISGKSFPALCKKKIILKSTLVFLHVFHFKKWKQACARQKIILELSCFWRMFPFKKSRDLLRESLNPLLLDRLEEGGSITIFLGGKPDGNRAARSSAHLELDSPSFSSLFFGTGFLTWFILMTFFVESTLDLEIESLESTAAELKEHL